MLLKVKCNDLKVEQAVRNRKPLRRSADIMEINNGNQNVPGTNPREELPELLSSGIWKEFEKQYILPETLELNLLYLGKSQPSLPSY